MIDSVLVVVTSLGISVVETETETTVLVTSAVIVTGPRFSVGRGLSAIGAADSFVEVLVEGSMYSVV